LEKALAEEGPAEVELALGRILMLTSIALVIGGIPLLYLGDEFAMLNDYDYAGDPARADDSRWGHRPAHDTAAFERRAAPETIEGRLFAKLNRLIAIRHREPVFAGTEADFPDLGNDHVFGLVRHADGRRLLALANVTEQPQTVDGKVLRLAALTREARHLVADDLISTASDVTLEPYQVMWIVQANHDETLSGV